MSKVLKGLIVSNELKACPFCGGEVTESRGENISTIECPKCDYELLLYTSKILDTWNSRPTEPERQIAIDLFKTILDEATGDLDNPNKRIWPLHSTTYKAIRNLICDEVNDE